MARFKFCYMFEGVAHCEVVEIADEEFAGMDIDQRDLHANACYERWILEKTNLHQRRIPNEDQSWMEL